MVLLIIPSLLVPPMYTSTIRLFFGTGVKRSWNSFIDAVWTARKIFLKYNAPIASSAQAKRPFSHAGNHGTKILAIHTQLSTYLIFSLLFLLAVVWCCTAGTSDEFQDKPIYLARSVHTNIEWPLTCEQTGSSHSYIKLKVKFSRPGLANIFILHFETCLKVEKAFYCKRFSRIFKCSLNFHTLKKSNSSYMHKLKRCGNNLHRLVTLAYK